MKKYLPVILSLAILLSVIFIGSALSEPSRSSVHLVCQDCGFQPAEGGICYNVRF